MSAISAPNAPRPASAEATAMVPQPWLGSGWLLGMVLGAGLQLQQAQLWSNAAYGAICALAGLLAVAALCLARRGGTTARRRTWCARTAWLLALLSAALAMGALSGWRAASTLEDCLLPALEGEDLQVTGWVAAMPQRNEAGTRLRLAVQSAKRQGLSVRLPPVVDVAWYVGGFQGLAAATSAVPAIVAPARAPAGAAADDEALPRAGELWQLTLRLKAPHGLRNPHGFDYELWAWEQGVQATGYVRTGTHDAPPQRLASSWRYPVEQARQTVRDAILRRLAGADGLVVEADEGAASVGDSAARARTAGVVAALVTGDQRAIDRADWDLFRATGVAHLMSISGLHITLFAWLAALGVGALWRRSAWLCQRWPAPSAALACGVALAAAYAVFSGWGVPAQRTVIMLATIALLRLSGRRWPWPQVWLLACAAVVLADPWALAQAGFWLSFVAVGALFATNSGAIKHDKSWTSGHFYALLREQWVVTLALTPLSLLLFGQISVVSLAANLLAIPWVTLVVTPLALGGVLCPPLWTVAAWALQPLTWWLQWLAQWPWAVMFVPAAPWWASVAAVAGGVLLAARLPWRLRCMALPLLLPVLAWQPARPAPGQFELLAVDIGQGNAVLVRTATHSLLYDAGPRFSRESDAGHRVLVPLLRALGERVDLLMLSHRDADHTGGAAAVLAQQPQARLSGSLEASHPLHKLRAAQPCQAGQQWQWDGVLMEVLHPLPGASAGTGAGAGSAAVRPNALSCVLRIAAAAPQGSGTRTTSTPAATALLVGDIEAAQEQALVARTPAAQLRADWLLVPHHGSKTSSSAVLLDAVAPRTAMVQAGYRNRFGHPTTEVLARYRERGISVIESTRCGAATWQSWRPEAQGCERDAGLRYWHHRRAEGGVAGQEAEP